jgi:hypothetical protein
MDIIQLMISHGATNFNVAIVYAASRGHMDIVQLMISKGATNFNNVMVNAAQYGHMDIVQLMICKGAINFNGAMVNAAQGGHMDIVQFMISKGATMVINNESHNYRTSLYEKQYIIADFLQNLSRDEVKLAKYRKALVKYFQVINNRERILTLLLVNRDITFGTGIPSRILEFF